MDSGWVDQQRHLKRPTNRGPVSSSPPGAIDSQTLCSGQKEGAGTLRRFTHCWVWKEELRRAERTSCQILLQRRRFAWTEGSTGSGGAAFGAPTPGLATVRHNVPRNSVEAKHMLQSSPVSAAEGSFGRGTKCADLEKQSTTVIITMCPWEGRSPFTKSMTMCDQGRRRIASGCRSPAGSWCEDFPRAQVGQAAMKVLASRTSHQNRWRRRCRVRVKPG